MPAAEAKTGKGLFGGNAVLPHPPQQFSAKGKRFPRKPGKAVFG